MVITYKYAHNTEGLVSDMSAAVYIQKMSVMKLQKLKSKYKLLINGFLVESLNLERDSSQTMIILQMIQSFLGNVGFKIKVVGSIDNGELFAVYDINDDSYGPIIEIRGTDYDDWEGGETYNETKIGSIRFGLHEVRQYQGGKHVSYTEILIQNDKETLYALEPDNTETKRCGWTEIIKQCADQYNVCNSVLLKETKKNKIKLYGIDSLKRT